MITARDPYFADLSGDDLVSLDLSERAGGNQPPDTRLLPPGQFYDTATGKIYDISQAYEGCTYDTGYIPAAFADNVVAYGWGGAIKYEILKRIPGYYRASRLLLHVRVSLDTARIAFGQTYTGPPPPYRVLEPKPERLFQALHDAVAAFRYEWND